MTVSVPRSTAAVGLIGVLAAAGGCDVDGGHAGRSATAKAPVSSASSRQGKTSCTSVRYIGDSISVGMVSVRQVPSVDERLEARLHAVGVQKLSVDASGGRATFERFMGRPSTTDALQGGPNPACYVMATGTNDAGNIGAGADADARQRIDTVMKAVGGKPVLWPLLVSRASGAYANANMQRFDDELRAATKRYPNLRLYDWPAERDPRWTESDGLHDTRAGSRARALMYARALTVAFPAGGAPSSAVVVGSVAGGPASAANAARLAPMKGDANAFWAADTPALTHYVSGDRTGSPGK